MSGLQWSTTLWDFGQVALGSANTNRCRGEEADHVTALLWRARAESSKGGLVSDLWAARDAVLVELWDFMQGLTGLKGWSE